MSTMTLTRPTTATLRLSEALRTAQPNQHGTRVALCYADGGVYTVTRTRGDQLTAAFSYMGKSTSVEWDELPEAGWIPQGF